MLKPVLKSFFSSRPVWHTAGAMLRPRGVYVLMYHRIDDSQAGFHGLGKERFEAQLAWLNNNCTIIDPEQLDQYLNRPPRRRPAVLLTFDDGYRCVHSIVAPALRKFKVRGLVFLPTRIIDEESLVWTDRLNWAFSQTSAANICFSWDHENEYQLETAAERSRALGRCKAHLKQLPDNERRAREQEVLESLDMLSKSAQLPRQMLNWNEARDTTDAIIYGGHTHTHPILSSLDARHQEKEIAECQERISQELGHASRFFAYPNGRKNDFNEDSRRLLKKFGFDTAFSTEEGVATIADDPLAIRRLPTTAAGIADFAWLITHRG